MALLSNVATLAIASGNVIGSTLWIRRHRKGRGGVMDVV
jgi:hypothetical protein